MKIQPRCCHKDGDKRCPDSGGYHRIVGENKVDANVFCLKHRPPNPLGFLTVREFDLRRVR